ncbi:MAG TPA: hypothetical protein VHO24_00940 [Opitutaceae bacterium]|nr:hypothetical protein [Opitutaceae bacterium]
MVCLSPAWAAEPSGDRPTVIVVVGAAGEEDYGPNFKEQAEQWEKACQLAGAQRITLGLGAEPAAGTAGDYEQLKQAIAAEPKEGIAELWLVLIGHGTFDGKEAKFNLRGPDLSATELAEWLKPVQRPLAVINTSSASAPFLNKLSGLNRVIISATRTGNEQNFARFGRYFAETLTDPRGDFDQDGQTSLLEAFLSASAQVSEFYKTEGRLATEHALLDDNGDGLGTPADWFRGTRATKQARNGASLDGARARQFHLVRSEAERKLSPEQRARRDELELTIENLRATKTKLGEAEYYRRLEKLLLELARVYAPVSGT